MDDSDAPHHAFPTRSVVSRDDWLAATPSLINDKVARPTPSILGHETPQATPSIVPYQGDQPALSLADFKQPPRPRGKSLSRTSDFDIDLSFLDDVIEETLNKLAGGHRNDHSPDKPNEARQWDVDMSNIWQTVPILPEWVSHHPRIRPGVPRIFDESQVMFQRACFPKGTVSDGTFFIHGVDKARNMAFVIECRRRLEAPAGLTSTYFDLAVWPTESGVYILSSLRMCLSHQSIRLANTALDPIQALLWHDLVEVMLDLTFTLHDQIDCNIGEVMSMVSTSEDREGRRILSLTQFLTHDTLRHAVLSRYCRSSEPPFDIAFYPGGPLMSNLR
jgi:hypothetical protein